MTVLPSFAQAQEASLFHCQFANAKEVTLRVTETGMSYAFGRQHSTPELTLWRTFDEIEVTPWNGVGRSIWEDIAFANGDVTYRIWGNFDRMTEEHEVTGGILVERGDEDLARLDCLPYTVNYTLFSFSDAYEAAGYCWDLGANHWQERCE
ncbi:hypothetical protein [Celeribacter sp. PS-C1]|uniref:hypothetical protein n=1 Tax=Celeribacter sp. PS-C1 TaxID=2820813 RepID=UPI001CA4E4F8|nr:hypothetical protein [Celeribacter sp. PS-C1]MBW6416741.1 hypothetical protein [Celeribacter sp. PS-C1]